MTPKVAEFLNLGMRRDVADSKVSNEYVYENKNVRIDTNDGDTTFSATNERGNLNKYIKIPGVVLGVCELLDGVVVFSKASEDLIESESSHVIIDLPHEDDEDETSGSDLYPSEEEPVDPEEEEIYE